MVSFGSVVSFVAESLPGFLCVLCVSAVSRGFGMRGAVGHRVRRYRGREGKGERNRTPSPSPLPVGERDQG